MRCPPLILTAFCALAARPAMSQPNVAGRELVGFVRDSSGQGIEGATVELGGVRARTDSRGAFRLYTGPIDTVTLAVRHLGFAPVSALITARNRQWDTVVVELERVAQRLAPSATSASATTRRLGLRDFEERRDKGLGEFITRADIEARNTMRPSEVLRTTRGVRLVKLPNGGYGVRFASYAGKDPNCAPNMWLDGKLVRGLEVDDLSANDIEAMELYESWTSTPTEFSKGPTIPCGTIVVWSRIPGR